MTKTCKTCRNWSPEYQKHGEAWGSCAIKSIALKGGFSQSTWCTDFQKRDKSNEEK